MSREELTDDALTLKLRRFMFTSIDNFYQEFKTSTESMQKIYKKVTEEIKLKKLDKINENPSIKVSTKEKEFRFEQLNSKIISF